MSDSLTIPLITVNTAEGIALEGSAGTLLARDYIYHRVGPVAIRPNDSDLVVGVAQAKRISRADNRVLPSRFSPFTWRIVVAGYLPLREPVPINSTTTTHVVGDDAIEVMSAVFTIHCNYFDHKDRQS